MGVSVLSDWERDELVYYRKRGWDWFSLANYYGITERSAERIYYRETKRSGEGKAASSMNGGQVG